MPFSCSGYSSLWKESHWLVLYSLRDSHPHITKEGKKSLKDHITRRHNPVFLNITIYKLEATPTFCGPIYDDENDIGVGAITDDDGRIVAANIIQFKVKAIKLEVAQNAACPYMELDPASNRVKMQKDCIHPKYPKKLDMLALKDPHICERVWCPTKVVGDKEIVDTSTVWAQKYKVRWIWPSSMPVKYFILIQRKACQCRGPEQAPVYPMNLWE